MWPGAVAAPAVLSDQLIVEPLQITTDGVKRVTGQHLIATASRLLFYVLTLLCSLSVPSMPAMTVCLLHLTAV